MKKTLLTIVGLAALATQMGFGQVVLNWNFGTASTNASSSSGTPVNFTISTITIGNSLGTVSTPINSSSASSGYAGSSGQMNVGNAFRIGSLNTASGGSGYFEFTITPEEGYTFTLTNFDFGFRSTSTGPQAFALRSSQDSYATDLFTGSIGNNSSWSFKNNEVDFTSSTAGQAITFRLYGYGGSGSASSGTINGRMDDLTITVEAIPEPATAVLFGIGAMAVIFRRRMTRK